MQKIKEDLFEDYREVFHSNKAAKIRKCEFCENDLVYPFHFLDENNNQYLREYVEDYKM